MGVLIMKYDPEKVERVIANVRASMAVEGMKPSTRAQSVGRKYLEGKISGQEAVNTIKMQHVSAFGK
ncbi:MAG: hypothetical protein H6Q64_1325 [Firmicutes bacterium]|nr:hypothetical protein [Bacillota bacterium]